MLQNGLLLHMCRHLTGLTSVDRAPPTTPDDREVKAVFWVASPEIYTLPSPQRQRARGYDGEFVSPQGLTLVDTGVLQGVPDPVVFDKVRAYLIRPIHTHLSSGHALDPVSGVEYGAAHA